MPPDAGSIAPARLFHGWVVVWAAFAVMFLGFGGAYSFTVFFSALQETFDASRGRLSLAFSIAGGLWFLLGAVSGPIADRFGPRGTALFGMTVAGLGLLVVARASAIWQVYLGFGVCMGIGVGFSYVPAIGAVQRWFVRRRGFASGVAVSGIGVGTLSLPPLAGILVEQFGWRWAAGTLGLLIVAGGGIAAWLLDDDPHRRGLAPDDDPLDAAAPRPVASGMALGEAVRTRAFAALFLALMAASLGLFIPFVHLVPYAEDHGVAHGAAVLLVSGIGVGSTAGRFLLGGIADRIGRRLSFGLMFVGMGCMLLWWLASADNLAARDLRACLRHLLRRLRGPGAVDRGGFLRRQERQRHHRRPLRQRRRRDLRRPAAGGLRLRSAAELYAADPRQHRHHVPRRAGGRTDGAAAGPLGTPVALAASCR